MSEQSYNTLNNMMLPFCIAAIDREGEVQPITFLLRRISLLCL